MMSRGGFGRQAEIRYITNYRTNIRNANQRKLLKHLTYKDQSGRKEGDSKDKNAEIFAKYSDCTICLEPFKHGQRVTVLPGCNHIFHKSCCQQWLDYRFRCPNCNLVINFDEEERN